VTSQEDLVRLAGGVVDQYVPGGRIGPPPAEAGVQRQSEQDNDGPGELRAGRGSGDNDLLAMRLALTARLPR
jgi:hypothetical protein